MSEQQQEHFFCITEQLSQQFAFLVSEGTRITLADMSLLIDVAPTLPLPERLKNILSAQEVTQLSKFSLRKRYLEWLSGRITAKLCLSTLMQQEQHKNFTLADFSILPDDLGRPVVVGINNPPTLSISHSGTYAVAMASRAPQCGVDIQSISPTLEKVAARFTNQEEKSLFCDNHNALESLAIIWATKEAVKKSMLSDHPEVFSITHIQQAEKRNQYWKVTCSIATQPSRSAVVHVTTFDTTVLACTTGGHHA
ncbi:MAG: hypothetical protein CSB34_05995 [Desulfobulbus propionicus]|nr:MAG: hypothetical protein CSB34_05995 [Desulfobulbus propionicus]